jgi:hypothetical protein
MLVENLRMLLKLTEDAVEYFTVSLCHTTGRIRKKLERCKSRIVAIPAVDC